MQEEDIGFHTSVLETRTNLCCKKILTDWVEIKKNDSPKVLACSKTAAPFKKKDFHIFEKNCLERGFHHNVVDRGMLQYFNLFE